MFSVPRPLKYTFIGTNSYKTIYRVHYVPLQNPDSEYIGTEPWNAMEVMNGGTISDKTDMYSYGLIIWEMIALAIPHVSLLGAGGKCIETVESQAICDAIKRNESYVGNYQILVL